MEKPCRRCNTPLPQGANYCPECGTKDEKLCDACGNAVEGMKFCIRCGARVEPPPKEEEVTVPSTPIPQTAPCEPPKAGAKRRKGLFGVAAVLGALVLAFALYTFLGGPENTPADPVRDEPPESQQTSLFENPPVGEDDPQNVPEPPQQNGGPAVNIVDHMTLEQVFETLDGVWYTGEFIRDGMTYIWARTEEGAQVFETGILSSEQKRVGTVSGFVALGENRYDVTVTFPAAEETLFTEAMDEKTITLTLDLSYAPQGKLTVSGDIYAKEDPALYAYAAANLDAALYLIYG